MREQVTRRYAVSSVERTFCIIEALAGQRLGLGLSQLTERLKLPKSTVFGILVTLEGLGYVEHDPDTDRYKLGLRLYSVAARQLEHRDIVQIGSETLRRLADELGETANLGILREAKVVYLVSIEGHGPLKVAVAPGSHSYAHCTALGKVLLAHVSDERMLDTLTAAGMPRCTPHTIIDPAALRAELQRVRADGYALDDEEENEGVRCVAAPVRDERGGVIAAISITAPAHRLPPEKVRPLAQRVTHAARSISGRLGYVSE